MIRLGRRESGRFRAFLQILKFHLSDLPMLLLRTYVVADYVFRLSVHIRSLLETLANGIVQSVSGAMPFTLPTPLRFFDPASWQASFIHRIFRNISNAYGLDHKLMALSTNDDVSRLKSAHEMSCKVLRSLAQVSQAVIYVLLRLANAALNRFRATTVVGIAPETPDPYYLVLRHRQYLLYARSSRTQDPAAIQYHLMSANVGQQRNSGPTRPLWNKHGTACKHRVLLRFLVNDADILLNLLRV